MRLPVQHTNGPAAGPTRLMYLCSRRSNPQKDPHDSGSFTQVGSGVRSFPTHHLTRGANLSAWAAATFQKWPSKHGVFRANRDIYLQPLCWRGLFGFPSFSTSLFLLRAEASVTHVRSSREWDRNQSRKHGRGVKQAGQHIYILSHIRWHLRSATAMCVVFKCEG